MKKSVPFYLLFSLLIIPIVRQCGSFQTATTIAVFPDSVLSDVSHHPIGINLDYFMDDDNYLKPPIPTAEALKKMGVRYLRYPGGNKSDFYFFSKPPWERSEPTLARTGRGAVGGRHRVLKNYSDFGVDVLDFDEFMEMCAEIGAEPVICVAADEYLVDYPAGCTWASREELIAHAVEWVRYANIKKGYGVKYWLIGNESWHRQNINSTAEIYARDVVDFSKAMKAVDPAISVVPNGNSVEFWEKVITIAGDHVDHLCFSNYPVYEYKAGYATYRDTLQDLMHPVRRAQTAIERYATPAQKARWKLINAEYGPFDWGDYWPKISNMGMTLATFEMTGHQLNEPDLLFSCYWNTRWINNDSVDHSAYDALDRNGNFNAIGMGLAIWGTHLGEKMVKTTGTVHLRSFASFSPSDGRLFVYLINTAPGIQAVELKIAMQGNPEVALARELVGNSPEDVDPVWQECEPWNNPTRFSIKGNSITVIEYGLN
jgi:hypothetical protein